MKLARSIDGCSPLVTYALLTVLAAVHAARPAAAQTTVPARPTATAPAAAASAATRPATGAAATSAAEEEDEESYVFTPAPPSYDAEREFWIWYVGLPVLAMLAVIAVGVVLIRGMRRRRPPTTPTTTNDPTGEA